MRYIFTKDNHFRFGFPSPVGRKDTFNQEIDNKIKFIINYCKDNDIKYWFTSGDLFDIKAPSKYTLIQINENQKRLRYIKDNGIILISISGNHDLPGASYELYESSLYHNCVKADLIKDCSGLHIIEDKEVLGLPYTKSKSELIENIKEYSYKDIDILMLHEHCVPNEENLFGANFITYKELAKFNNIHTILCGHLHKGYHTQFNPHNEKQLIVNPWNLTRLARDYYSVNDIHKPMLIDISDDEELTFKEVEIPIIEFQYAFNIDKLKEAENTLADITDFMKQIDSFQTDKDLEIDNLPIEVANKVKEYLERT